jgi:hypothetical protein
VLLKTAVLSVIFYGREEGHDNPSVSVWLYNTELEAAERINEEREFYKDAKDIKQHFICIIPIEEK